jgi:methylamine dehydrogenase accessory protein MauD
MDTFYVAALSVLVVADVLFVVTLLALARQVGLLMVRIGPTTALPVVQGPAVGDAVPVLRNTDLLGQEFVIGLGKPGHNKLLLFVTPKCPICQEIESGLATVANSYKPLTVLVVSQGKESPTDLAWAADLAKAGIHYICDEPFALQMGVGSAPFAMTLDNENVVLSKGLVNDLEQLESLLSVEFYELKNLQRSVI